MDISTYRSTNIHEKYRYTEISKQTKRLKGAAAGRKRDQQETY